MQTPSKDEHYFKHVQTLKCTASLVRTSQS